VSGWHSNERKRHLECNSFTHTFQPELAAVIYPRVILEGFPLMRDNPQTRGIERLSMGIMPKCCLLVSVHTHLSTDWVSNPSCLARVNQRLSANSLVKIWARFNSSSWSGHDFSLPLSGRALTWQHKLIFYQSNNRRVVKVQGCGRKS